MNEIEHAYPFDVGFHITYWLVDQMLREVRRITFPRRGWAISTV